MFTKLYVVPFPAIINTFTTQIFTKSANDYVKGRRHVAFSIYLCLCAIGEESISASGNGSQGEGDIQDDVVPTIWTLSCQDNLVVAGCANGRIEVCKPENNIMYVRSLLMAGLMAFHTFPKSPSYHNKICLTTSLLYLKCPVYQSSQCSIHIRTIKYLISRKSSVP